MIQLSSDTKSGANDDNEEDEGEVDGELNDGESIVERFAARRRAIFVVVGGTHCFRIMCV